MKHKEHVWFCAKLDARGKDHGVARGMCITCAEELLEKLKRRDLMLTAKAGKKRNTVILDKDDFNQHAHDLQVWEALTDGLPADTQEVEVLVIGKVE